MRKEDLIRLAQVNAQWQGLDKLHEAVFGLQISYSIKVKVKAKKV